MSSGDPEKEEPEMAKQENGEKNEEEKKASSQQFLDPRKADAVAQSEFQQKYGFVKKPPALAQRKISQGGKQYFDSGDYNMQEKKSDRQDIASYPHAMKEQMAQLRAKATIAKAQPSKLAGPTRLPAGPSRLAGPPKLPGPSRLATQPSQLANATRRSPLAQ